MMGEITYVGFGDDGQTPHAWVDVQCEFWAYCHEEERLLYALWKGHKEILDLKKGTCARIADERTQPEDTKGWTVRLHNPAKAPRTQL